LAAVTRVPLRATLEPELVIVQSLGMRRWLAHELARAQGVSMNARFPFPAHFAHQVFAAAFPEEITDSSFAREVLPWRVLAQLPARIDGAGWEDLRRYLEGDLRDLKEYQLAHRIAAVFDRYLAYRPELLLEWQASRGPSGWQPELWRALIQEQKDRHPAALLRRLEDKVKSDLFALAGLPERLSLFGISSLPPFYLHLLQTVARGLEVHLFLLEPTDQYWGDIHSRREQDRLLRDRSETAEDLHLETGNPLLASLGKIGRDFTRLVQDLEPVAIAEDFAVPSSETLLAQVQADIFELHEPDTAERAPAEDDRSIRVHCCHGPMREVEVLHDQLLELFESLPGLTPRDILVAMPDIESYAPFIEAVFGSPDDEQHAIPFSIADRSLRVESSIADTFLELLDLHGSRFTAPAVLALLDDSAVRRKFALLEGDLGIIRNRVGESGIRWGIDAEHRAALGFPGFAGNTWRVGLDRLLLGYALSGDDRTLFEGVLPMRDVEGAAAEMLGRFAGFAEALFDLIPKLATPRTLAHWEQTLRHLLQVFFDDGDESADEIRRLREVFAGLGEMQHLAAFPAPISFAVLRAHLGAALEDSDSGSGFLAGRVTFCALKPMRAIPFRVLCLLGMNDTAFPRRDSTLAFDLTSAAGPRRGDRSQRDDDRYLFLEAILSARSLLYLSYSGLSPRDNSVAPPSAVVSELLDYLEHRFGLNAEKLVTRHRLQPFSPAYFQGDPRLFSYSEENARTSERGQAPREESATFCQQPLPGPDAEWLQVDVHRLAEFFAHPAKFFGRERLRLALPYEVEALEENEPLQLAGLERYGLGQDLTALALSGEQTDAHLPVARAAGILPAGFAGDSAYLGLGEQTTELADRIQHHISGEALPPVTIQAQLGDWELSGTLHGIYPQAQLRHRAATLKGKDVIRAWIWHLALQLAENAPRETLLLALETTWKFRPVENARDVLADLLSLYRAGLCARLPFFPTSSMEYARRLLDPRSAERKDPLAAARQCWTAGDRDEGRGEGDDPWFELCFPPDTDPLDRAWQELAIRVFTPLFAARQEVSP
ncbi:MAG TPA: exodeoxyribonuclease V subunit gamma, partial [Chthoniobacteraceae bacterium]